MIAYHMWHFMQSYHKFYILYQYIDIIDKLYIYIHLLYICIRIMQHRHFKSLMSIPVMTGASCHGCDATAFLCNVFLCETLETCNEVP